MEVLEAVVMSYRSRDIAARRTIVVDAQSTGVILITDVVLLERVLGNMIKNALEASQAGQTVTVGCRTDGKFVEFWVNNLNVMPRTAQLQVFQRSFSTKGSGRGLGTYSMKLISERYLKGAVAFTSCEEQGTTFVAKYPQHLDCPEASQH
jgi:signal transduction histidine kinase